MSLRRSGVQYCLTILVAGCTALASAGCSRQPDAGPTAGDLALDPVASGDSYAQIPKDILDVRPRDAPDPSGKPGTKPDSSTGDAQDLNTAFGSNDIERSVKNALRIASKGDHAKAATLLDQVLAVDPLNREALLGRAAIAFEEARRAKTPKEGAAPLEKAVTMVRTLLRAMIPPSHTRSRCSPA